LLEQSDATAEQNMGAIEKLRAKNRKLAGANGIDRLIREYKLHALIAPSTHPATLIDLVNGDHILGGAPPLAAIAGYPHLTVPMGLVQGLPIGMSFIGPAWSEELLLSLGYAFEQRTAGRRPPRFLATVEPKPPSTP
jgi:amidase